MIKRSGATVLAEVTAENAAAKVTRRRLTLLWAATAAATALHNTEEWLLDMTGWIAEHPWLPGRSLHGDQTEFALVLAVVTTAVLVIAATAVVAQPTWSAEVLVCLAYALMINGTSHVLLSLLSLDPMPGVISGIVVLWPLGVLVTRTLPAVRWTILTTATTVTAAVGITAGAFALASAFTGFE